MFSSLHWLCYINMTIFIFCAFSHLSVPSPVFSFNLAYFYFLLFNFLLLYLAILDCFPSSLGIALIRYVAYILKVVIHSIVVSITGLVIGKWVRQVDQVTFRRLTKQNKGRNYKLGDGLNSGLKGNTSNKRVNRIFFSSSDYINENETTE